MSVAIAVVGLSGSGKSSSMMQNPEIGHIGLNPSETFIINVKDKPLPFRGWKKLYTPVPIGAPPTTGNYFAATDGQTIVKVINYIGTNRPDIKNIVVEDMQYIMSQEFMDNALKTGYEKFSKMAKNVYDVINAGIMLPEDRNFIILTHSEEVDGKTELKTLGRLLSEKVNLAGLFTVVLYTTVKTTLQGTTYNFATNQLINDYGIQVTAKSPMGMFADKLIPNDLGFVLQQINEYNNG